jgi:hypothetical protein
MTDEGWRIHENSMWHKCTPKDRAYEGVYILGGIICPNCQEMAPDYMIDVALLGKLEKPLMRDILRRGNGDYNFNHTTAYWIEEVNHRLYNEDIDSKKDNNVKQYPKWVITTIITYAIATSLLLLNHLLWHSLYS